MPEKADFNAEEWSLLRQGPPLAGLLIMQADRGGSVSESLSIPRLYAETRQLWGDTGGAAEGLVEQVIAEGPELDRAQFAAGGEELEDRALAALRKAMAVMARKGSEVEVEDYRRFVLTLARRVAEAHKEGGFLGIGGQRVSAAEQDMLDRIATAVGADSDSP